MPNEFQSLADSLYRERVLRARRTMPEACILDDPCRFDYASSITLAGLPLELPHANEEDLRRRLEIRRKLELAR